MRRALAGGSHVQCSDPIARLLAVLLWPVALGCGGPAVERAPQPAVAQPAQQEQVVGRRGGRLAVALRAEPGTLNPVLAVDRRSMTVRDLTTADLIHINRVTQRTEPALAESWSVSGDGRLYTVRLRRDVLFSDGEPFDADDVVFTFEVYLDPAIGAVSRGSLMVEGEPIRVEKIDSHTVTFELASPYAAGERLFDSIAILPEHVLSEPYRSGAFPDAWSLGSPMDAMAGLGPFLPTDYRPGESLVLSRNPNYWKADSAGTRLPYLDEIVLRFVSSEDVAAIRFQNGEIDILDDLSAENYEVLERHATTGDYALHDLGPGLTYNFLFFNLNGPSRTAGSASAARQKWFLSREFRRAVSEAIDREAIRRLVYENRATELGGPVSGGNRLWRNEAIGPPVRSIERARSRLADGGFSWNADGNLVDDASVVVEFTIITNSSSTQRIEMAAIVAEDLRQLGISAQVVPLEFQSVVQRLLETYDYDACVLGLGGGDVDPNSSLNIWLSSGSQHLWAPMQTSPATEWEAEIDSLMRSQVSELDPMERKRQYDRVQEILATELPLLYLVSPNPLTGASLRLGNFRPTILEPSTLWNADRLFWLE